MECPLCYNEYCDPQGDGGAGSRPIRLACCCELTVCEECLQGTLASTSRCPWDGTRWVSRSFMTKCRAVTPPNYIEQLRGDVRNGPSAHAGSSTDANSGAASSTYPDVAYIPRATELGAGELRLEYQRVVAMRQRVSAEMDADQIRRDEALAAELLERERAEADEAERRRAEIAQRDAELALKVASSASPPPDARKPPLKRGRSPPDINAAQRSSGGDTSGKVTIESFIKRNIGPTGGNSSASSHNNIDSSSARSSDSSSSTSQSSNPPSAAPRITAWLVSKRPSSSTTKRVDSDGAEDCNASSSQDSSWRYNNSSQKNSPEEVQSTRRRDATFSGNQLSGSSSATTNASISPLSGENEEGHTSVPASSTATSDSLRGRSEVITLMSPMGFIDSQETYVHPDLASSLSLMPMLDTNSMIPSDNIIETTTSLTTSAPRSQAAIQINKKPIRVCSICTFENYYELTECEMCDARLQ